MTDMTKISEPFGMVEQQAIIAAQVVGETMSGQAAFDDLDYFVSAQRLDYSADEFGWVVCVDIIPYSGATNENVERFILDNFDAYDIVGLLEVIKSSIN